MDTATDGPAPAQAAAPVDLPDEISLEDARNIIDSWGDEPPKKPAESAEPATAEPKSAPKEQDSDQAEPDPAEVETKADDEEEQLPPIERPRSWAKDLDEEWATYPRAAQERIAKREQERDSALSRSQQEVAEQRKAVQAERDAMAKLRTEYETKLPNLSRTIEEALQNEFSDIKSIADVRKLQSEDPFRFQQWQLRQMELSAAQKEAQEAEGRKNQERQTKRNEYEQAQNALLIKNLPDMGDPKKASELRESAMKFLNDQLDLPQSKLQEWWNDDTGHQILSSAAFQQLVADGLKFRDLQNAPKAVAAKPLPPVVKPGSASGVTSLDAEIRAAEKRLEQSGSEADGWALLELRAKASARKR